jgi:hypothetical protein
MMPAFVSTGCAFILDSGAKFFVLAPLVYKYYGV